MSIFKLFSFTEVNHILLNLETILYIKVGLFVQFTYCCESNGEISLILCIHNHITTEYFKYQWNFMNEMKYPHECIQATLCIYLALCVIISH